MKSTVPLFLFSACIFLLSCHTARISSQTPPGGTPQVVPAAAAFVAWDKKSIDLGAVKKGDKRSMFYEFTNLSGEPAQIDIVDACDCTTVDYPRGPIAPGQKGRLDVIFNSAEKDAAETISINVIFKNTHDNGVPRIEILEYKFDLVK